jgi:hypothetical protein
LDGGSARDEVEKLGWLSIKQGSFDHVHGDECKVVEDVHFNSLDEDAIESIIYNVSNDSGGW